MAMNSLEYLLAFWWPHRVVDFHWAYCLLNCLIFMCYLQNSLFWFIIVQKWLFIYISINFYFNRFYQSFHLIKNIFGSKREHGMLPDDRRGYSAVDILMIWFLWPFGEEDIDFFLCFSLMCQKWDIEQRAVIYEALRIIESVSHTFDCRVVPGVSFLRGQRRHFHDQMNSRFCLLKQREFDKNRKRRLQFITWFHIQRWSMEVLCWTIE